MKKKNGKKGFTLVELLAALVILGLLTIIAAPNIVGILQNTKLNTYVNDAEKLVSLAEYKFRGDTSINKPTTNNQCIFMSLGYLGTGEFQNPPYGGEYSTDGSYVVIVRKENASGVVNYEYYVQLVELEKKKNPSDPDRFDGIKAYSYEKVKSDSPTTFVETGMSSIVKVSSSTSSIQYKNASGSNATCTVITNGKYVG